MEQKKKKYPYWFGIILNLKSNKSSVEYTPSVLLAHQIWFASSIPIGELNKHILVVYYRISFICFRWKQWSNLFKSANLIIC